MLIKILIIISFIFVMPSYATDRLACTMIGCVNGLTIKISPDYKWQPGNYKFDFIIDGKNLYCEGSLPFSSCEQHVECDEKNVIITESGCMMPGETHGFGDIYLHSSPKFVTLEVKHNGTIIGKNSFYPNYISTTPNGTMCEPECHQATVQFELK